MITENQLLRFCPGADKNIVEAIARHAPNDFTAYGITTDLRIQHFLAHVAVESGYLRRVEENLNYSAKRLMEVWPNRFPTKAIANRYANNPQALANFVYGGRLGNTRPNDGWEFRGKGLLQTTGVYNVQKLADHLGVTLEDASDMLVSPDYMLRCACATFVFHKAMFPADDDDIVASTKAINGGKNGLKERTLMLKRAKTIFV